MSQFINQKGGSLLIAWLPTSSVDTITVKSFEEISALTGPKRNSHSQTSGR
jgi:hypothetical protein